MNQPHKHAEVIKAWADGAQVQVRCNDQDDWEDVGSMGMPSWHPHNQYRVKPEPEYPETRMDDEELRTAWAPSTRTEEGLRDVANAAIKQAIIDGDVIINPNKTE